MMTAFNLTEDQAITAITVGVDFSVSQVVNGNWGMQTIIPKVRISQPFTQQPQSHRLSTLERFLWADSRASLSAWACRPSSTRHLGSLQGIPSIRSGQGV